MSSKLGSGLLGRWLKAHGVFQFYAFIFARPRVQALNRILFRFSARGLGYNLFGSFRHTGEEWFLGEIASRFDLMVSFDVGANIGRYSELILSATGDGVVYAFEPVTATYERLKSQVDRSGGRLLAFPIAAGAEDGRAAILVNPNYDQTASIVAGAVDLIPIDNEVGKYREDIVVRSLDSFCDEMGISRLDFVKIDCEGYECEVLQGMQRTLSTLRPKFIQFEFNTAHLLRRQLLSDLIDLMPGYSAFRLLPNGLVRYDPLEPSDNLFLFSNHIAVRDDLVESAVP